MSMSTGQGQEKQLRRAVPESHPHSRPKSRKGDEKNDDELSDKVSCRPFNLVFLILFLAVFIGYFFLAYISISSLSTEELTFTGKLEEWSDDSSSLSSSNVTRRTSSTTTATTTTTTAAAIFSGPIDWSAIETSFVSTKSIYSLAFGALSAFVCSITLLIMLAWKPVFVIWLMPIMAVCGFLGAALVSGLLLKDYLVAGGEVVFALLYCLLMKLIIKRLEFAKLMLQAAAHAAAKHKVGVYGTVILSMLVQLLFTVFSGLTIVSVFLKWEPDHESCTGTCSWSSAVMLVLFSLFAHSWISSVFSGVMMATLAGGPFRGWFYNRPKHLTFPSFVRLVKRSIGSIALGALIMDVIEFLHMIVKAFAESGNNQVISCLCLCCLSVLEKLVHFFNKYVYIHIAVNKCTQGYVDTARDVKDMFLQRSDDGKRGQCGFSGLGSPLGITAAINDDLTSCILHCGCIVFALVSAGVTFAFEYFLNTDTTVEWIVAGLAFLLAFAIGNVLTKALAGGVSTIFVCIYLGTDENGQLPLELKEYAPELYTFLQEKARYFQPNANGLTDAMARMAHF